MPSFLKSFTHHHGYHKPYIGLNRLKLEMKGTCLLNILLASILVTWFAGFSFPCLVLWGLNRNNTTAATSQAIMKNIMLKFPFPSFPVGPGAVGNKVLPFYVNVWPMLGAVRVK